MAVFTRQPKAVLATAEGCRVPKAPTTDETADSAVTAPAPTYAVTSVACSDRLKDYALAPAPLLEIETASAGSERDEICPRAAVNDRQLTSQGYQRYRLYRRGEKPLFCCCVYECVNKKNGNK